MKTDELISMLSGGAVAVEPGIARRRYATAVACGAAGAVLLMLAFLGLRPDLGRAFGETMLWAKFAYAGAILAGALLAARRLAVPGMTTGRALLPVAAAVVAMWLYAAAQLAGADPAQRDALIYGESWRVCPFYVALLSVPAFAAFLWAARGLAPTRLAAAGAAAGLAAGALSVLVYVLHCPESGAPFVGLWYLLGMLIPAAAGAALGPRVLRW